MNKYVSPIIEIENVEVDDIIMSDNDLSELPETPDIPEIGGDIGGGTGNSGETPVIPLSLRTYFNK
jgi:hypothetical protein